MKAYEHMEKNENLGWCIPFVNEGKAIAINEGETVGAIGIDIVNKDPFDIIDEYELTETGCASCPWRDACDAMNL